MEDVRKLFDSIPDTVIVTDTYGYVLDFNRAFPFADLKKGKKLTRFIPDCFTGDEGGFACKDKSFLRYTASISNGTDLTGYTVRLLDVTEKNAINAQIKKRSEELAKLAEDLSKSNARLSEFVERVRELSEYSEQLRLAGIIHDGYGHALTEVFTICQMCLSLRDSDPDRCVKLLSEGIDVCRRAGEDPSRRSYSSLKELLGDLCRGNAFPAELEIRGEEPAFMKERYRVVASVFKEAYHNTLSHSMADRFYAIAEMDPQSVVLTLYDNGNFSGPVEKGFGLRSLEERVAASNGETEFFAREGGGFCTRVTWRAR